MNNVADETTDKEDVIETQDEGEVDKEDVIEDEVRDTERQDNDVMGKIGELFDTIDSLRADMITIKDNMNQFVEAGGVVREEDSSVIEYDADKSDFVPIEELDLNL